MRDGINLNSAGGSIVEVEVIDPELGVQGVIDAVREEIEGFCVAENIDVSVFNVDGCRFKFQLEPSYLSYQIGTIVSHLREVIGGILIVVVDKFEGDGNVNGVGFEGDDEPTVVDRSLLTRNWEEDFAEFQKRLECGVIIDVPSFTPGDTEKEEDD
jgi:hypothetical protein